MRRLCGIWCLLWLVTGVDAQQAQFAYRISFADKAGSPAPALSPRSLQRRASQGISLDSTDRPVTPIYRDSVLLLTNGILHNTSRWLNQCVILLTDSSRIHLVDGKPYVQSTSLVGYFPNGLHLKMSGGTGPATQHFPGPLMKTTGSPTYYNKSYDQTALVNGDFLHDQGFTGQGKIIAVLDAGFFETDLHVGLDSLRQRGGIVDAYNFRINAPNVYVDDIHGTEALSTMAGYLPGTYVGSAPGAQYALYLTDDHFFTDALYELDNYVAGLERADSIGADVISSSVGYNEFFSPAYFLYPKTALNGSSTIVAKGVNLAVSKGMFVVTTAGNEGGNSWNFLLTPGDADSSLTVGSVNAGRTPSGFSSPGPNALGRIKPDVCAQGEPASVFSYSQSIINSTGTSWSTPQIAGWVACLWQANSQEKPYRIRQAVIQSADHYTNPGPQIGYGIPDFRKAFQSLDVPAPPAKSALVVSPNPFSDQLLIRLPAQGGGTIQLQLMDVTGRILLAEGYPAQSGAQLLQVRIPANLPAGTYFLKTQTSAGSFLNKLSHR